MKKKAVSSTGKSAPSIDQVTQEIKKSVKNNRGAYTIARKIFEQNCSVKLTGIAAPYALVDMNPKDTKERHAAGAPESGKKCDYLFVGRIPNSNSPRVAVLELKRGQAVYKIVEQLQAGAAMADRLIPHNFFDFKFRPVAVIGGRDRLTPFLKGKKSWRSGTRRKNPHRQKPQTIRLRNCAEEIRVFRRGCALKDALNGE